MVLCVRWPHKCEKKNTFGKYIRVRCVRKYIWKYITLWCVRWLHMCLSKNLRYIWYMRIYYAPVWSLRWPHNHLKISSICPQNICISCPPNINWYFLSTAQENSLTCQYVHKDLFSTIFCKMAADAQCSPLKNLFFNVLKSHLYKSVPDTFQSNPKASDTKDRLEWAMQARSWTLRLWTLLETFQFSF